MSVMKVVRTSRKTRTLDRPACCADGMPFRGTVKDRPSNTYMESVCGSEFWTGFGAVSSLTDVCEWLTIVVLSVAHRNPLSRLQDRMQLSVH